MNGPDGLVPKGQPGIVQAALFGCCPRCGARTLFARPLLTGSSRFADRCPICGLDFTRFNVGDGPAAFLTLIVGALITALALWLQLAVEPPFWVHILLWVPLTILAVLFGLRAGKAALLAAEFRRDAGDIEWRGSDNGRPHDHRPHDHPDGDA